MESVTWIECAGHLQYLKSKLCVSETIVNEIESAETVNEEYFLIKMKEFAKQVKESSSHLLELSSIVLDNLQSSKGTLDEYKEDTALPLLDPAERSTSFTENQKKYLIRVGPHQPILQQYPHTTRIANEGHKHSRFNPAWFKEYPHLEYSLSKDAALCFECCLSGTGPGAEKADSAWVKEGVRSWHKFKSSDTFYSQSISPL